MSIIGSHLTGLVETACRDIGRIADGLDRRNALLEESNAMAREHNGATRAIVAAAKRIESDADIVTCDDCDRKLPLDWATTVDDVHFCPSCVAPITLVVTCEQCSRRLPIEWASRSHDGECHFCPSCSVELMAKEQAEDAQSQGGAT